MDNKTVLITGASRGIGRAFAVLCAKNKDFEFINRFKNDGEVLRAIAWHQLGQHDVYKEHEDELRKGAKS